MFKQLCKQQFPFLQPIFTSKTYKRPFGKLGISISASASALASASVSAFKYEYCLLQNINF